MEEYYFQIVQFLHLHFELRPFDHHWSREIFDYLIKIFIKHTLSSVWKLRSRAARFRNSTKSLVKLRLVI